MRNQSLSDLLKCLLGQRCNAVHRDEHSWRFVFGERNSLAAECLWRIISNGRLVLCNEDDGQKFGHPVPVDALAKARLLLVDNIVRNTTLADETADLRISFENGPTLELISTSSGYEAWQAVVDNGRGQTSIIGIGGGGIAVSNEKNS